MEITIKELNELLEKEFERGRSSVQKEKTIDWTTVWTPSTNSAYIPEACKNCSQHPSNGGSGLCNCILPYDIIY